MLTTTTTRHLRCCVRLTVTLVRQEEVIRMANEVRYGLAGSVWTSNLRRGHRVAHSIDAGILWVNCWLHRCVAGVAGRQCEVAPLRHRHSPPVRWVHSDLRTPFGGMKDSGTGREGGKYSLEFYSETKNVCIYLGRE